MIEEKKNINLGFRATASRQEALKIAAAKRRQSVQEMIEEALEALLEEQSLVAWFCRTEDGRAALDALREVARDERPEAQGVRQDALEGR
jgi:uncharacterized protein (DUF1778 family)